MIAKGKTDIGKKRKFNEDAFFVSTQRFGPLPNLYIVADGMGGHKAGSYASNLAIQFLCEFIDDHDEIILDSEEDITQFLKRALNHANYKLFQRSESNPDYKGMGTTLTVSTVVEAALYTAHVGDSRLYMVSDQGIWQITKDHSLVQEMVTKGYITKQEARKHPKRHIITRAVGTYEKVQVDTYRRELQDGGCILLCSDGITTMLSDDEIHTIVMGDQTLGDKVNALINLANQRGGRDNITVVLAIYNKVVKAC